MPKRKSLLKRIEVQTAQRKRTCKFTGDDIVSGQLYIVVFDAPRISKGYCRDEALKMIQEARSQLDEMEQAFT